MQPPAATRPWLIGLLLALVGLLLVFVPGKVLETYQRVQSLEPPYRYLYLAAVGTGAAILLLLTGSLVARLWRAASIKAARRRRRAQAASQLTREEQHQEIAENLQEVEQLCQQPHLSDAQRQTLEELRRQVEVKQATQKLEIVAFGTISSGKSALLNALSGRNAFQTDPRGGTTRQRVEIPWSAHERVLLVDTPGLGEIDGREQAAIAAQAARDADLVLLVVDGPLRRSEHELLTCLARMDKTILLCLNKADWYSPDDQARLRQQLLAQVQGAIPPENIVVVRAEATVRPRLKVLADGSEQEEEQMVPPDVSPLAQRMLALVTDQGQQLLLANLLWQSRALVETSRQQVEAALDRQAREIIDRYTWASGAAAALSPLPLVDLFASGAITVKLLVDLARVYHQPLDLDAATTLLTQLGKNFFAILGVNAATPAVSMAVASLLKTVPLAGTLAGGLLQATVQALVTRWIGLVFQTYLKAEMKLTPEGLADVARRQWKQLTDPAALVAFAREARRQLASSPAADASASHTQTPSLDATD
jgi:small GTP-binding protein